MAWHTVQHSGIHSVVESERGREREGERLDSARRKTTWDGMVITKTGIMEHGVGAAVI